MEYTTDVFFSDGGSLTQRLCRLMTSFDETVAVVPYRSDKAVSRYDLWLVPADERRVLAEYTRGVRCVSEAFRLYLRHRALTAEDILKAEGILTSYVNKLAEVLADTEAYGIEAGTVNRCATDGSVWEFYLEFALRVCEEVPFDGVRFYVAFGKEAPVSVGVGCTLFRECVENELHVRRYFDGEAYVSDKTGGKRSIDFDFEATLNRCALTPLLLGEEEVTVYAVSPTGRAEMARYVLSELSFTDGSCKGKLVSDGEVSIGTFNDETGEFIYTDTERRGTL